MKKEIWKKINGYEDDYQVSSYGRIKSLKCKKTKILKCGRNPVGYRNVTLYGKSKPKTVAVHLLVAEHFLGDKPDGAYIEVSHINEDKECNYSWNLKYVVRTKGKYKGVYIRKGKIIAAIYKNNKKKYLGIFKNEEDAHLAYMKESESL